jgi:opacity protein-like surface antigen
MMKRLIAILVFAVFFALPALAAAEVGVYVAPRFLLGFQDSGVIKGGHRAYKQFSETVYGGGLAVGYNFAPKFDIPVRVEVEYDLRTNAEDSRDGVGYASKYVMNLSTGFLNVYYDINTGTPFTPFVGAGVGMAFHYAGMKLSDGGTTTKAEKYDSSVACNVGVGLSWAFTKNIAADLGYRWIYTGEYETDMIVAGSRVKASPYLHEVYLGARITF